MHHIQSSTDPLDRSGETCLREVDQPALPMNIQLAIQTAVGTYSGPSGIGVPSILKDKHLHANT